jgi:hypothetical protein
MRTRLVPHAEWFSFLKGFSRRHADDPVTVQVLSPGLGSQVEAHALPLEGIMAGRRTNAPISISVGRTPDRHVEHEVSDPSQVWVQMSEDGAEQALDIESQDGTRTIVQLEAASRLEPRPLLPR